MKRNPGTRTQEDRLDHGYINNLIPHPGLDRMKQNKTPQIAALAVQLPVGFPKDPADGLIAATAIAEGGPLVTADERIRQAKAVQAIR